MKYEEIVENIKMYNNPMKKVIYHIWIIELSFAIMIGTEIARIQLLLAGISPKFNLLDLGLSYLQEIQLIAAVFTIAMSIQSFLKSK